MLNKDFAEAFVEPAGSQCARCAGIDDIMPFTQIAMKLIAFFLFFFSVIAMALKDIATALVAILSRVVNARRESVVTIANEGDFVAGLAEIFRKHLFRKHHWNRGRG